MLLCRRHKADAAADSTCGNPYAKIIPFHGIGVKHSSSGAPAKGHEGTSTDIYALYQGIFISGFGPMWLLAHRGTYRVHSMDNREALGGSHALSAVPVAAMAAWNRPSAPYGFVVVTGGANTGELRFCRMPPHVRLCFPVWHHISVLDTASSLHDGGTSPEYPLAMDQACFSEE
jgi:hypothetical protein